MMSWRLGQTVHNLHLDLPPPFGCCLVIHGILLTSLLFVLHIPSLAKLMKNVTDWLLRAGEGRRAAAA